jgi:Raf kinase inhibitor-like YbhB/YbcL family protein
MRLPLLTLLLLALPPLVRADLRLSSPDFTSGASIPARFTCQGQNISPTLQIAGVPPDAQSLVLIVDDPDAPAGTFTHWLVWNIPPDTKILPGGARADSGIPGLAHHQGHPVMQGTNDFGRIGYSGPCPPSGAHRYFFRLSALNTQFYLPTGASRKDLESAIRGHVIASAVLMGRYAKTSSQ